MFQKIKEKFISFFNNLWTLIGNLMQCYALFELLNQLLNYFLKLF
jgi:hypothetical protein